ncbi:Single-stranded DNA-binding protein [Flavobacteriaceae bacterium 3519-10]|nr:Single-stranded DNA-binding protein [Flavobacteriaceae bacterium 3519-10]
MRPASNCLIINFKAMSLRNKVTLVGRTGKDVEIVNFENGKLAKVSLATSDYYTNGLGEKVEETQWHNLVAGGKLADIMQKYVEKGKEIAVEGKVMYRTWDDKTGAKHYMTEIRVEELVLLGSK